MPSVELSIQDIARRQSISESSAGQLVNGLLATGGRQVQFNIPEFGGMGQWMHGMVMAGDMFNHALKARVDADCQHISRMIASGAIAKPATVDTGDHQIGGVSQQQADGQMKFIFTSQRGAIDLASLPMVDTSETAGFT